MVDGVKKMINYGMINMTNLNEEDQNFVSNMRVSIEGEMEPEFRDEMLLDLEVGVKYLSDARRNGDTRQAVEIWDEWERKKLENEDLEGIV
jgi:hypothetical protein